MSKTNKELAVDLACAVIKAISESPTGFRKPFSALDVDNILNDCYSSVLKIPDDFEEM